MADNSVAPGRMSGPDFFADDDPLAELARIAGYDERPEPRSASRREPAFNLEDELLRAFESYDSPRLDPVEDFSLTRAPEPEPAFEPSLPVEALRTEPRPEQPSPRRLIEPDPFAEPDPFPAVPSSGQGLSAPVSRAVEHGPADWRGVSSATEAADLADEARFDASIEPSASYGQDVSFAAPQVYSPSFPEPDLSPRSAPMPSMEPDFEMDLISELETSLAPVAAPSGRKTHTRPPAKPYEPGFRMPLTNFVRASEPVREPVAPVVPDTANAVDPFEGVADVPGRAPDRAVSVRPVARMPVEEPYLPPVADIPAPPQNQAVEDFSLQDLPSVAARFSPIEDDVPQPARAEPASRDIVSAAPAGVTQGRPAPALSGREEPEIDLMQDVDFELTLDDLDLDFSDILPFDDRVTAPQPPAAASAAAVERPAPVARPAEPVAVRAEDRVERAAAPAARPAAPPVVPVEAFDARPATAGAVARSAPEVSTLGPTIPAFLMNARSASAVAEPELRKPRPVEPEEAAPAGDAFDPALFAETDDVIETVPDLHVPELPAHEPEQPVPPHSDFDLHLDSELASLIDQPAQPKAPAVSRSRATATVAVAQAPAQPAAAIAPAPKQELSGREFEDFEKALEEDFRRAMAQTMQPTPSAEEDDEEPYDVYPVETRRRAPRWLLPASAAGFLVIVGVSGYVWYAGDTGKLGTDGAPVIIAADTEAVKVVPENPGGKTVPNQDKAVYDRVASGALHDPKQPSLISSEEQPMDVVQKTLMPDNLPLQGEEDGAETASAEQPATDTQDPRLLPQQGHNGEQAAGGADQLAVMPRRVKTMIVRPDGTLVEQVTDTVPQQPAAKVAAAPALAEPVAAAPVAGIAQPQPGAAADMAGVDVAKATPLTGTAPAETAPAAEVTAGVPQPGVPVPTARPSVQPVKVVASVSDQGAVRPNPAPQAQAPAAAAAPAASAMAGGYYIQIASLPSEADAQKSYSNLSSKYASLIGGRPHDIARADVPGKGTYYRVRIAAGSSRDEAVALCESYRAAGGTCLIAR
ncbi:SPOR domain-containing protein [Rhizobium sp. CSW-27]|uniref:SPOR domain-containing protein n=1 Tax=Rhizobium sp. CSW-27 TaxID=2839985 RepID=UPI001C00EF0F|nr:SPOR domain-containing protein [Rhizobium sp. CSW-27]MBT9370362.1 SPOR domain-containing protein [Rhizobium sp. CSW-27]